MRDMTRWVMQDASTPYIRVEMVYIAIFLWYGAERMHANSRPSVFLELMSVRIGSDQLLIGLSLRRLDA